MSEQPETTNTSNGETTKAKKTKRTFIWTEQKRAQFEKMRAKRAENIAAKKQSKESEKGSIQSNKNHIERIIKLKEEMKKILQVLDEKKEEPITLPTEEIIVKKPKPKIPEPVVEEYEDEEEEYEPPPPPIHKPKRDLYRYTSQNQHFALPKAPQQRQPMTFNSPVVAEKPKFTFL
jgi:hypothetical protein